MKTRSTLIKEHDRELEKLKKIDASYARFKQEAWRREHKDDSLCPEYERQQSTGYIMTPSKLTLPQSWAPGKREDE